MMKSKWVVALVLFALLFAVGCSDDSNPNELLVIQTQVSQVVAIMAIILAAVDPFASGGSGTQALDVPLGGAICSPSDVDLCQVSGTLEECPNGPDIDVVFSDCSDAVQSGTLVIDGTLTYTPTGDWPSGIRTVEVLSTSFGSSSYTMTLDGTNIVSIFVENLTTGTQALCEGDLEAATATCEILVEKMP